MTLEPLRSAASNVDPDPATLRRFAAIIESTTEAMIAAGPDGTIEIWNPGAARLFGFEAAEVVGWHLSMLLAPSQQEVMEVLLRDAGQGRTSEIVRTLGIRKDGGTVDLSVTLSPLRGPDDVVTGTCLVARDVSSRRRAEEESLRTQTELARREAVLREALMALRKSHEEVKSTQLQLIQAAKLESIGRLAAGVAHEVKNPLAVILSATEYLMSRPELNSGEPGAILGEIRTAVERAKSVIGGLLNYSSASELRPTVANISAVVQASLQLVHHALASGRVHVVRELNPDLPHLSLDVPKIEQVLINLLINAIDAMPEGGTLTVRTRRTQLTAADPDVGVRGTDPLRVGQTVVMVEIEDSGTGIPDQHLGKVLDPFFTTKPTGKGTGLGLAVSKTIVAMHGGTIWIRNRPEGGVVATIVLRSFVT